MTTPATPIAPRLERRASENASARAMADAATARLARLQSITAALSNTVTQDGVAQSVLHEAIIALECDAGAVVVTSEGQTKLTLLREAGSLDPLMRSFEKEQPLWSPGPYAEAVEKHANSAKTVFLRAMSHELRTPLNAISGYTEILEMGLRGPVSPAQATDLGRIKRAAAYLLRLINDVLTVARLEGERPLRLASIAVNPALAEVEGLCALQAKAKGLTLVVTQP